MPKVTLRALGFAANRSYAPCEKALEILLWIIFELVPLLLNESLQLREELFDWIQIR